MLRQAALPAPSKGMPGNIGGKFYDSFSLPLNTLLLLYRAKRTTRS